MASFEDVERRFARGQRRAAELSPGLGAVAVAVTVSVGISAIVPALSALTVAVVLGVLVGGALPAATAVGCSWAARRLLRTGVVLLGLQLGLQDVVGLGAGTVAAVAATVLIAFVGSVVLGKLLGVSPGLGLLVATGFSICGASAIAAMDSVTRAEKEEVATAVTLVTLYGSAAIALVPLIGHGLGMAPEHLGAWAGLSVHEVAQVVAAASPAGAAAVSVAVVIKLTRVVLLAPMVAVVGMVQGRNAGGRRGLAGLVPLFVLGFLVMIAVRSAGVVPGPVLAGAKTVTTLLFAAALFSLGTKVRPAALLRTGKAGLVLGALSTVLIAFVALAALEMTPLAR